MEIVFGAARSHAEGSTSSDMGTKRTLIFAEEKEERERREKKFKAKKSMMKEKVLAEILSRNTETEYLKRYELDGATIELRSSRRFWWSPTRICSRRSRGSPMAIGLRFREFNVDGKHMLSPTSKFLDFKDSYSDMEAAAGGVQVTGISYTKEALKDAVAKLATSTDKKERAKSLIIVAQTLSEAARFVEIGSFFGSQFVKGEHLPTWMRQLENDWGKYSKVVQCKYAYANYKFQAVTIKNIVYNTASQLRSIFGIMLKEKDIHIPGTCGIKKLLDEATVVLSANI